VSFFVFIYGLCFKVYFVWWYCNSCFPLLSIGMKYLFPSPQFQSTCVLCSKVSFCRQQIEGFSFSSNLPLCVFWLAHSVHWHLGWLLLFFFAFLPFLGLLPKAYGSSQARGPIGAVATSLFQSNSNESFQATSANYTTAHSNATSLTHWARPGSKPMTSWFIVRFINDCTTMGTPTGDYWYICICCHFKPRFPVDSLFLVSSFLFRIGWFPFILCLSTYLFSFGECSFLFCLCLHCF